MRRFFTIFAGCAVLMCCRPNLALAWDYGDGRHGTFLLSSSTTIEQLYLSVRLPADPAQYNPSDPRAVPNFKNFTVTNSAVLTTNVWNGSNGGAIVCRVQNVLAVDVGAAISASGLGYAGGGDRSSGSGPGAGGAGTAFSTRPGSSSYLSGAGGGYGSGGGGGTSSSSPAVAGAPGGGIYGDATLTTLYLGSGGGGGAGANGNQNGGNGGGVIALYAGRLRVDGQIDANGTAGAGQFYAGGGGGSGGSILLRLVSGVKSDAGNIVAAGGGGGQSGGGTGGSGRIRIECGGDFSGLSTNPAPSAVFNGANDADGDGIPDTIEWGTDPSQPRDTDGDGIPDFLDLDSDNDGIPDSVEAGSDPLHPRVTHSNGIPDYRNGDSDGDGIPDAIEAATNPLIPRVTNANGIPDYRNLDSDGDGIPDAIEAGADPLHPRDTDGDGVPDYRDADSNNNGIPDALELNTNGSARTVDSDGDGLPDYWETFAGLNPNNPADPATRPNGNPLTYLQIFRYGLNPKSTDTDSDGLSDFDELFVYGTNPLLKDTDGDGMPDKWEVDNGLDPRRNDANEDRDFDFLTNAEEYNGGVNSSSPSQPDTDGNGVTDYQQRNGGATKWDVIYDRNDRLLGVRHERGASFGYRYDANGNPVRQAKLGRDNDGDGLPDVWEFAYGLNVNSGVGDDGPNGDPDGDGWTNLQEFRAGTHPRDATSKPGANGALVSAGGFQVSFVPTRFVEGVGQLDNAGTAEIVVGADGNPGASANFVRVYTESGAGWSSEDVSVGAYGVTSIVVGQLLEKSPAIYVGLRKAGGAGRVVELLKKDGAWLTSLVAESQSEMAEVIGLRTTPGGTDLALNLATRVGPDGALYRAAYEASSWKLALLNAEPGRLRGTAALARIASGAAPDRVLRLLDAGGIQDARPQPEITSVLDDFNGGFLNLKTWNYGGAHNLGTHSVEVADGLAKLDVSWANVTSGASAYIQTELPLTSGLQGAVISISSAGHTITNGGRNNEVTDAESITYGGAELYAIRDLSNHTDSNILIHLFRFDGMVYFRRCISGGPWSAWESGTTTSNTLIFGVSGRADTLGRSGSAFMKIDSVRFASMREILSAASSSDFAAPDVSAYRSSTGTWYFQTPTALSWRAAQSYAFARGANLATVDSTETNAWLQGKFSGDFWLGYYRDFSINPWRWVSGSVATYAGWLSGQPGAGSDQVYVFANGGAWSSATGSELKRGIFEVKAAPVGVAVSNWTEPPSSRRLQWSGRNLSGGFYNPGAAGESSVIESFVEDNDNSGTVSVGDEFAVAELLTGASGATTVRTLSRRTLTRASLSRAYGLATLRSRADASEMLVTAEPDGQLFMWTAATAGGALQSQLMSVDHLGKSWHALDSLPVAGSGDALVGLRVDPVAPQRADVILFTTRELAPMVPINIQQSPPSARILASPDSGAALARVDVRVFDSEGNQAALNLQFLNPISSQWQDAALVSINGAAPSTMLTAPPQGATHQVVWNARQNLGATFKGSVMLRARGSDFSSIGEWSAATPYSIDVTDDVDGDGLSDAWERLYFGDLRYGPGDDPDGDGSTNLQEFLNGTLPNSLSSAKYSIAVSGVGAIVGKNPDQPLYDAGATVVVTAAANAGLSLIGWTGGGTGAVTNGNSLSVIANANKVVTAYAGVPLGEAVDAPALAWTTGGSGLWVGQMSITQDGLDAAESSRLGGAGDESWIETVVNGPGVLTWRWRSQFVAGAFSSLILAVNGAPLETLSSGTDWTLRSVILSGAGSKVVRWRFARSAANPSANDDRAWLDTVSFSPVVLPTITTQPLGQTLDEGRTASFSVVATGTAPLTYRWHKNGSPLEGATDAAYSFGNARPADAGSYTVIVSNSAGSVTSDVAVLLITGAPSPPVITNHPIGRMVLAGQSHTFVVSVAGTAPFSYFWSKGGVQIPGETTSSLVFPNVQLADVGSYVVTVTNSVGSVVSNPAALVVGSVRHSVAAGSYAAGSVVTISNTFVYTGTLSGAGWHVLLPAGQGWSYVGGAGAEGDVKPLAGTTELLEWAWTSVPPSPLEFSYTLRVPAGQNGEKVIRANADLRQSGVFLPVLVTPDPLVLAPIARHAADTDGDGQISLFELTRVIELYNTRNGTVRTGSYKVRAGTEDGFEADSSRTPGAPAALARYHSADTRGATAGLPRDGALDLFELTRVIELYNTRAGTVRTGQYHVEAGTEDGFSPGP